jgi:hypothetical protein
MASQLPNNKNLEKGLFILSDNIGKPIYTAQLESNLEQAKKIEPEKLTLISAFLSNCYNLLELLGPVFEKDTEKLVISTSHHKDIGFAITIANSAKFVSIPAEFLTKNADIKLKLSTDPKKIQAITSEIQNRLQLLLSTFEDGFTSLLTSLLGEMIKQLEKYCTFITIFDLKGNLIASTMQETRKELSLAKEIFLEITKVPVEKSSYKDFPEIISKQLGDLVISYFFLSNYAVCFFSIGISINPGIVKLKLQSLLKSKIFALQEHLTQQLSSSDKGAQRVQLGIPIDPQLKNFKIIIDLTPIS